jgi:AcrR family transcriptional regulator
MQRRATPPKRRTSRGGRSASRPTQDASRRKAANATPRRRRRSASEARERILEAAQQELMRVGPESLRLTDLARQLQVSHPAILHHFGSREELVAAVVRHSLSKLYEQLIDTLQCGKRVTERLELIEMVSAVCGQGGLARLLAWLLLSGHERRVHTRARVPLKQLADTAHMLRRRFDHPATYADTLFEVQLLAIVLLGEAVFGEAVWRASGAPEGPSAAREFRRRLTQLLPT